MVQAINNIQVIRIPFTKNDTQFLFPCATSFQNKTLKRIIAIPPGTLFSKATFFLTLKNKAGENLVKDIPLTTFSVNSIPDLVPLNSDIDWEASYIRSRGNLGAMAGSSILYLYIIYDDTREIEENYSCIRTVTIPSEYSGKLSPLIDGNYGYLKKIVSRNNNKASITLNCKSGRTFNDVRIGLFCAGTTGYNPNPIFIADYDLDFNNSTITNPYDYPIYLTFYFGNI